MIPYNRPVITIKKSSWLVMVSCMFSSIIFTVWGGCLLLGCLLYIGFSNRGLRNLLVGSGNPLLQIISKKRG